jgi:hypothetical protein
MKNHFEHTTKSSKEGFTLIKVLTKTYLCEFLTILAFLTLYVSIQSLSPYLTSLIMRYVAHKDDYAYYYGGMLFATVLLLQMVKSLSEAHMGYRFTKLGINLTNSLTLLIYSKSLKYQSIAEKEFSEA